MTMASKTILSLVVLFLGLCCTTLATPLATPFNPIALLPKPTPTTRPAMVLQPVKRQAAQPYFPSTPASCPICRAFIFFRYFTITEHRTEQNYGSINSCAQACPILANVSEVISE
jgi:cell division cycle protein 20 (cofactor of APC complex)